MGRFNEEATKPPSFPLLSLSLSVFFPTRTRAEGRMTYRPSVHGNGRAPRTSLSSCTEARIVSTIGRALCKARRFISARERGTAAPLSDRVFTSHQDDDVGRCRRRPRATISRPGAIFPATPADSMIDAFRIGTGILRMDARNSSI